MSSYRESLTNLSKGAEEWFVSALSGNCVEPYEAWQNSYAEEIQSLTQRVGAWTLTLRSLWLANGVVTSIDEHLRSASRGVPQSIAYRRVDLWGRLTAFRVLLEEFTDGIGRSALSSSESSRLCMALAREAVELLGMGGRELGLRGELSRVAPFLDHLLSELQGPEVTGAHREYLLRVG